MLGTYDEDCESSVAARDDCNLVAGKSEDECREDSLGDLEAPVCLGHLNVMVGRHLVRSSLKKW